MELLSTQPTIDSGDPGTKPSDQVMDPYKATTMKEMSVKDIITTTPVGDIDPIVTDLNENGSGTMLLSSYSDHVTDSSQFPMQHATQQLPSKTVSITTTDYSTESPGSGTVTPPGRLNSTITTSESADSSHLSVSSSQALSEGLTDSLSDTSSPSTVPLAAAGSKSRDKQSTNSPYEPSVSQSNSATGYISPSSSNVLILTSTDTQQNVSKQVLDSSKGIFIHATQSVDYVASTGDLYSPVVPSKTVFSSSGVTIESSSFKSTSAIPLTPGGKSINTVDSGGTAFFSGGFTDYILYIGVPACGLVILIFLIVCLVCLRKRKAKNKGSPMKNHVQDLWVNSQQEVSLTTRDPLREINGRENIGMHKDLGCTTYEAVFDFQAELETHLTLKQGDLVRVHRKEGNGWWRGTVGEHSGWFPNSYIQAAPQDKLETEDEIEVNGESNVSSFMAQPRYGPSFRDSLPSEKDIQVEPIYCKIQPKEKRKSFPKVPDKTPPKVVPPNRENGTTPLEDGSKYIAIYSYGGHFTGELTINKGDIIQGKALDRNGWMRGFNETTNQEGWCPTVHVDRLDKDEIKQLEPAPLPTSDSLTSLTPDPLTYKQLDSNQSTDGMKDWVGIVHKAVHDSNAEKAGDLEFEKGDLITVFQVLENGWWLGSKGKSVGWFPGSLVEMIPQPSPRIPSLRSSPLPSNTSQTSNSPVSSDEGRSITDAVNAVSPSKPAKLKPVRKAPPPPLRLDGITNTRILPPSSPSLPSESNESKIPTPTLNTTPKIPRPMKVAPPAPPVREEPIDHSPLYEAIGKGKTEHISEPVLIQTTRNDGLYDLIQHTNGELNEHPKDKSKPEVPKRYIKPKLVKIPRSEINIPSTGPPTGGIGSPNIARPRVPPPPRPIDPPKISLESVKINDGFLDDDIKDQQESEAFFHLPSQNRLGYIPKQDSIEPELDETPYNGMSSFASSFGSSFGSTFGKRQEKMENKDLTVHIHENKLANLDNFYETPIEQVTQSETSIVNEKDKQGVTAADQTYKHNTERVKRSEKSESDNAADISVQAIEDKPVKTKEKSVSRIRPPKHISLSQAEETKPTSEIDTNETNIVERQLPKQSRLPMSRKDSPAKHEANKDSISESENYHSVNKEIEQKPEVNQNKIDDIAVIDYTDITKVDDAQINQQEVYHNDVGDEAMRMRSESFNKPPVAPKPRSKGVPKLLAKAVNRSKSPDISNDVVNNDSVNTENITNVEQGKTDAFVCESGEIKNSEDKQPKVKESPKVSKLTKIAQKSPNPKRSGIPASPLMRMKQSEKQTKQVNKQKLSESDGDLPLSPTIDKKSKPESPAMARRSAAKQIANSEHNIRNRSNSPHGRTGIPTSLKQRSNSPASKLPRGPSTPSPGTPSPAHTPTLISKPRGLVPPKKIQIPKENHSPISESSSPMSATQSPDTSFDNTDDDLEMQPTSPKPERPSKPPRVVKQKSPDGKPAKHGRSLLPMIHKTIDGANGVLLPATKPKSGIPVSKPPRPPAPNSPQEDTGISGPTMFQAVRGYTAQSEEELSFDKGTFVTELSECDRHGWYVGMLADGTTGLYPAHCFKPNPVGSQSEA